MRKPVPERPKRLDRFPAGGAAAAPGPDPGPAGRTPRAAHRREFKEKQGGALPRRPAARAGTLLDSAEVSSREDRPTGVRRGSPRPFRGPSGSPSRALPRRSGGALPSFRAGAAGGGPDPRKSLKSSKPLRHRDFGTFSVLLGFANILHFEWCNPARTVFEGLLRAGSHRPASPREKGVSGGADGGKKSGKTMRKKLVEGALPPLREAPGARGAVQDFPQGCEGVCKCTEMVHLRGEAAANRAVKPISGVGEGFPAAGLLQEIWKLKQITLSRIGRAKGNMCTA